MNSSKLLPHAMFGVLLLIAAFLTPSQAWAGLPKPISAKGIVLAIDHETKTLVFKAAPGQKPMILYWDAQTEFIKNGEVSRPSALPEKTVVVISYKRLSFRNPLLKKALWAEAVTDKSREETKP